MIINFGSYTVNIMALQSKVINCQFQVRHSRSGSHTDHFEVMSPDFEVKHRALADKAHIQKCSM